MSKRSTPTSRRSAEPPAKRDDPEESGIHDRKTDPPPMTPEEYRRAFVLSLRAEGQESPRIEEAGTEADIGESPVHCTDPPTARRSESIARLHPPQVATPRPPRISDWAADEAGLPPVLMGGAPSSYPPSVPVPRPPPLPAISIPPFTPPPPAFTPVPFTAPSSSEPERIVVSTDRPTARALDAELADHGRVVRHAMLRAHVAGMTLDHRAGFLLSRIDGKTTIEELLDVSGMPPDEALGILRDLLQKGVISVDTGHKARRGAR